ncbi:acetyl-CoA acetyltransferase [Spongiibacter sp. KMU-166]|uniref:Acetyl-CoA acetyltransferase n=1 Tax=Spongiibacter thalassae TaxID=2721624 RepID=A0ABX1GBL2_9GAMM|nr:acetyl-CoA acetyltransferase [Spongiibacter thalassae]NKI15873.1 acetyl-CoA acetyltransferase [Spongiibacter thalassae]
MAPFNLYQLPVWEQAKYMNTTPILVGSGQVVQRDIDASDSAKSPVELAAEAAQLALRDTFCGELIHHIDTLAMVRLFMDSAGVFTHPFGSCNKPPLSVAQRIGARPERLIYGAEGGQSPQRFVNELAQSIRGGKAKAAIICGAEATHAMKTALRRNWALDWSENISGDIEDRGYRPLQNPLERAHGITFPPQVYALFENAWRHRHGLSVAEHKCVMAKLFARFSAVASNNPYSQFPYARSEEFLATDSDDNYPINIPYNKWLIAQDAVSQGAAVVMTSVGIAEELGIPNSQWVYLHGQGDADDSWVSGRRDLAASEAVVRAVGEALASAGKCVNDIDLLDIYSCFPIAVITVCEALGLEIDSTKELTVTGGLPYFGGAGNNYSLHAVAEMTSRLRKSPGQYGLVSANGGYLSKQSVGIYSTTPPLPNVNTLYSSAKIEPDVVPGDTDVVAMYEGVGHVESYSLVYKKGQPASAFIIGRCMGGDRRFLAVVQKDDVETLKAVEASEFIGRKVNVEHRDNINVFKLSR